jgi:hypothetical protein
MTRSRTVPAVLVALALAVVAAPSRADDATELERAKVSYDAGRYAEGVDRFKEILTPGSPTALRDPASIERAQAYYAACLIALDRISEANEQIEKIYRTNPRFVPDPVVFPTKVTDRFFAVQGKLKDQSAAGQQAKDVAHEKEKKELQAYIATLQPLAGQENVVVRHSRWIAAIPFGVGQFQNGQDGLGYALLVSEALLAGASITTGVIYMHLLADYTRQQGQQGQINYTDLNQRIDTARSVNLFSSLALGAITIAGVAHAELTFVPEVRESRTRPVPKAPPALLPTVSPGPTGMSFGVVGRF